MFKSIPYLKNEKLKKHTSFKIGGPAKYFFQPKDINELKTIISSCEKLNIRYFIIGNGTNLLVDDNGFDGAVISLKNLNRIKKRQYASFFYVTVDAGTSLYTLNNFLLCNEISGLEWSYGIPGSVGGAVKMNAGAYEGSICDFINEIKYLKNGKIKSIKNFKSGYREGFNGGIILSIRFKLKKGNHVDIKEKMNNHIKLRRLTQPYDKPSAGSIFKRKDNLFPSKIIDELGLKGMSIGDAMVSKKHAGFIVNIGNASCKDVLKLINLIKLIFHSQGFDFNEEIIYLK